MEKPNRNKDRDWYRYDPEGNRGDSDQPAPTLISNSLFIRNIALETSADIIRSEFEIFGPIRDIYLPKDFSTGMPKGYGFIKYQNSEDAKVAKEYLNNRVIDGQEISIEYSSDSNRKKPRQMALINSRSRKRDRSGDGKQSDEPDSVAQVGGGNKWAHQQSISRPRSSDKKGHRMSVSCSGTVGDANFV